MKETIQIHHKDIEMTTSILDVSEWKGFEDEIISDNGEYIFGLNLQFEKLKPHGSYDETSAKKFLSEFVSAETKERFSRILKDHATKTAKAVSKEDMKAIFVAHIADQIVLYNEARGYSRLVQRIKLLSIVRLSERVKTLLRSNLNVRGHVQIVFDPETRTYEELDDVSANSDLLSYRF